METVPQRHRRKTMPRASRTRQMASGSIISWRSRLTRAPTSISIITKALCLLVLVIPFLCSTSAAFLTRRLSPSVSSAPCTRRALLMAESQPFEARNADTGHRLLGTVVRKVPSSSSIVVLCHGLAGSGETGIIRRLGEELPYNTCRFDFAGNGRSEGDFCYAGYDREVGDLRAVVETLRSQGWTVRAVLGHSKGAHCVLRYAWTYDDVPNVLPLSARFDFSNQPKSRFTPEQMRDMEEKGAFIWSVRGTDYRVTKEDFLARSSVDMSAVQRIKRSKVFVMHGDQDETIPVQDAHSLHTALSCPSDIHILKGADHFFREPDQVEQVLNVVGGYLLALEGAGGGEGAKTGE